MRISDWSSDVCSSDLSASVQPFDYICSRIRSTVPMGGVRMAERASESEMQVLSALWDKAPQTAADLTRRIGTINGWTQATMKTMLARLAQKGAVQDETDGMRYLYSPANASAYVVRTTETTTK